MREFHKDLNIARSFIRQYIEKSVADRFKELLQYQDRWTGFDGEVDGWYSEIDPNFRIKIEETEEGSNYDWFREIRAISKHYNHQRLSYQSIELYHNDVKLNISTFFARFYEERLSIAIPNNLYFHYERDLYFDGYLIYDEDGQYNINPLLTYFFNSHLQKVPYEDFCNKRKNLVYGKPSTEFIPLIFFRNRSESEEFKNFIESRIQDFDYETLKSEYQALDSEIQDKRSHKNCCFHYWIYDLYHNSFLSEKLSRG